MGGRAQGVSKCGKLPDQDKKAETEPFEDHQKKEVFALLLCPSVR